MFFAEFLVAILAMGVGSVATVRARHCLISFFATVAKLFGGTSYAYVGVLFGADFAAEFVAPGTVAKLLTIHVT